MKKALFLPLLALLLLPLWSHAQSPITISGHVNASTGGGLSGTGVAIFYPGPSGISLLDSAFTNANGYYIFPSVQVGVNQGLIMIAVNCGSYTFFDSLVFNPTTTTITHDVTCQGSSCDATFSALPVINSTDVTFTAPVAADPNATYLWIFGDGTTGSGQQVTHSYPGSGSYIACLEVTSFSCTDTYCSPVLPGPGSNCPVDIFPSQIPNTLQVSFFVDTTFLNPNTIYSWDFGDGNSAGGVWGLHTYSAPGNYLVCLSVADSMGNCFNTFCKWVTVLPLAVPQCQADFTYQISPSGLVSFMSQATPAGNYQYGWDFGNGVSASGMNTSIQYSAAGSYVVCHTISGPGCADTVCQTIVIPGFPPSNCVASFSTQDLGFGTYLFTVDSAQSVGTYSFSVSGVAIQGDTSAIYQFSAPGTYLVCLTYADTVSGCLVQWCDSVQVQVPPVGVCEAAFSYSLTANGYQFTDSSSSTNSPIVSWEWSVGTTPISTTVVSSDQNPLLTFNVAGPWFVCLTIEDSLGCTNTFCETIYPLNLPNTFSVSGVVVTDSVIGTQSLVYLIEHDPLGNTLTAIDSQLTFGGWFHFTSVQPGSYLLKATLLPGSPLYANYLPTYLGDVLIWSQATATVVTNQSVGNQFISLVQGVNPGGPGFIGGLIAQGANKNGDPLPNVSVLLLNTDQEPLAHTITDEDGEYEFTNLAYGTYLVHVEIAGKVSEFWTVTIDATQPSFALADFDVHSTHVDAVGSSVGIDSGLAPETVIAYPNPTTGALTIELDLGTWTQAAHLRLSLFNGMGAELRSQEVNSATDRLEWNLSELPAGVYLLHASSQRGTLTQRIVKQ